MGWFDLIHIIIIGCYGMGTLMFLTGVASGNDRLKKMASWLAIGGFGLNTLDLFVIFTNDTAALYAGKFYFSILSWCVLALYFLLWWKLRLEFLAITALPLALLTFVASMAMGGIHIMMPHQLTVLFFGLHIGALILTMGVLILAAGAAIAFLYYNRKLKTKLGLSSIGKDVPSLEKFDKVNKWAVLFGFPLYTLGLFSSFFWYWISPDKQFAWDIMKITSLAVWFTYAFLFHQRIVLGWRGRKPAVITLWIFAGICISLIHHTVTFRAIP